nr:MAG TPA: hypothetical protein [Caudoviricetes sp.]
MVSYTIFTSPSNLFYFHLLATVPPPRQRVFPIFGTLQPLPFSHTSLNWYLLPKTAIHFSRYGLEVISSLPHFRPGRSAPLLYPHSTTSTQGRQVLF